MLAYRITHKKHNDYLYAPGLSGRWNGAGKKVLYCAESIPLAFLESMIRRQGVGFNKDFNLIVIEIPENFLITILDINNLPEGWRNFYDFSICQRIGEQWFNDLASPVLKAPSAILIQNFNFVLNALHKDFTKIKVVDVTDLIPDERIDNLLKNHKVL